ncbi:hypothetical protein FH972_006485 [Carpinus fangiana]|uniref:Uncharacterized protein n=1 Tax=Carpinus fangiana TaxID=176857 RepID=A0A5N6QVX6_9ROSI|nr:hypothetical protein FH972_006485 [Carpinus fangiana]
MAARFGATIVPFGVVGEDDIAEDESSGEVASQQLFLPGILPKIPSHFYHLFGKPIGTKGKEEILKNKEVAKKLFLQVKSEVEVQSQSILFFPIKWNQ